MKSGPSEVRVLRAAQVSRLIRYPPEPMYLTMQPEGKLVPRWNRRNHPNSRDGVNIATFDLLNDAEELQAILEADGIEAWVHDERRLQRFWFGTVPQAGVHVRVPESSLTLAQQRLQMDLNAAWVLQRAVYCPACHSCRVDFPAMTRKNALPALAATIAVALRLLKHECYCESCHYTWRRVSPTRRVDR
jgi:hypothetical protein